MTARPAGAPYALRGTTARRFPAVAFALCFTLIAAACGDTSSDATGDADASDPGPTELRVAYVPATTTLPLHVAEAQGYFDQHGLDVTLTEAANISDIPATLGRQFDIALGTATDLIRAGNAGVDVVQIAGNTIDTEENPFVRLIVRPDSGIDNVAQLEGKTVASPTLSGVIHAAVLYWAQEQGLDPSTITGVQVPPPNLPDQLQAGQVDAVEALEPFASQLVANGNVSLGDPFASIGLPLATNFWIASGAWARSNPDAIDGYVDALEQAVAYIADNPDDARSVLQDYTGFPPQIAETVPLPTYDLDIRVEDLATWGQVLQDIGQLDAEVDPNELVLSSGD